jgi:predicted  nucleic acid-binding Zn-ribbon protein
MEIITLDEIKDLQKELSFLYQDIQSLKARLEPLKREIDRVFREYQDAMHTYQARIMQLMHELKSRTMQKTNSKAKDEESTGYKESNNFLSSLEERKNFHIQAIDKSQEAIHKDQLLEYIIWAVPDDRSCKEFVGSLTEMSQMPSVSLADMLEQLPKTFFEITTHVDLKDLSGRFKLLKTWHRALSRRLKELQDDETNQRSGLEYSLWKQYQKGPNIWNILLEKQRALLQKEIKKLEIELREMN